MDGVVRMGIGLANEPVAAGNRAGSEREQVFRRLVDDLLQPNYRLAAVLLGNRVEAEDATHDAVIRAWRSFGELRDPDRVRSWFQRIVVNVCRDRLRQRQARPTAPLPPELTDPARRVDPATAFPERDALEQTLRSLSPDHRIVIALRFYADLPIDQIADRLGQRQGTVKSRLHHALKALRAAYAAGAR